MRALNQTDEYKILHSRLEGIELADSITVDGHKILNVVRNSSFLTKNPQYLSQVENFLLNTFSSAI